MEVVPTPFFSGVSNTPFQTNPCILYTTPNTHLGMQEECHSAHECFFARECLYL